MPRSPGRRSAGNSRSTKSAYRSEPRSPPGKSTRLGCDPRPLRPHDDRLVRRDPYTCATTTRVGDEVAQEVSRQSRTACLAHPLTRALTASHPCPSCSPRLPRVPPPSSVSRPSDMAASPRSALLRCCSALEHCSSTAADATLALLGSKPTERARLRDHRHHRPHRAPARPRIRPQRTPPVSRIRSTAVPSLRVSPSRVPGPPSEPASLGNRVHKVLCPASRALPVRHLPSWSVARP